MPPTALQIDDLTIRDARALASMFSSLQATITAPSRDHGYCIVIADRGHVFVGRTAEADGYVTITEASVIRYWGTERGLGELAAGGPTSKTKLDPLGEVRCPQRAVICIIPSEAARWKR